MFGPPRPASRMLLQGKVRQQIHAAASSRFAGVTRAEQTHLKPTATCRVRSYGCRTCSFLQSLLTMLAFKGIYAHSAHLASVQPPPPTSALSSALALA